MNFWDRTWALTRMTFDVIKKDNEMLLFPLLAAVCSVLFSLAMLFPTVITHLLNDGGSFVWGPLQLAATFATYFGLAFITTFFNTCVVYTTRVRLSGGDATFGQSVSFAFSRLGRIIAWSLLAASVGLLLSMLENAARNAKGVGSILLSILRSLLATAWNVVTLFVVPAMVYQDLGPIDAIKSSMETLRNTWGESLARHYGMGLASFVCSLPGVLVLALAVVGMGGGLPVGAGVALMALAGLYLLGVALVFNVANAVFNTALYHYATARQVPAGFSPEVLQGAFSPAHA
ncbi:MAG: DUF6159 family protein [Polyangiales bacterium]